MVPNKTKTTQACHTHKDKHTNTCACTHTYTLKLLYLSQTHGYTSGLSFLTYFVKTSDIFYALSRGHFMHYLLDKILYIHQVCEICPGSHTGTKQTKSPMGILTVLNTHTHTHTDTHTRKCIYHWVRCSSMVKHLLTVWWVVGSIHHGGPIELFLFPASAQWLV